MLSKDLFKQLQEINHRPKPFEFYTAANLWNDPYVSKKMLEAHLNPDFEPASRKKEFIDKSVKWIVKHFNISNKTKICDFGCGPGLYTTQFALICADVTGIDFSERSINYAKQIAEQKNIQVNYVNQDYLKFETDKKYNLITMIYCDFCALNDGQREKLLRKFHNLLADDGFLFFDVYSTNHFDAMEEKNTFDRSSHENFWSDFWSENPYYVFTNTFKYDDKKLLLDKYVIIEKTYTRQIFNWIKCYNIETITKELQQNGFNVIEHYSNVAGKSFDESLNEIAIVAKKD